MIALIEPEDWLTVARHFRIDDEDTMSHFFTCLYILAISEADDGEEMKESERVTFRLMTLARLWKAVMRQKGKAIQHTWGEE